MKMVSFSCIDSYCAIMYEIIRTFSPIFRGLNLENPRAAAAYYVNLIINFPTSLQGILNEAQTIYRKKTISRASMQKPNRKPK